MSNARLARHSVSGGGMEKRRPMLATRHTPGALIRFPVDVQPKLRGVRCMAENVRGAVRLTSRNGLPFTVPHIADALAPILHAGMILDGELYDHNADQGEVNSLVRGKRPDLARLRYHVFDMPTWAGERWTARRDLLRS